MRLGGTRLTGARDFHLQSSEIPKFLQDAGVALGSKVKISQDAAKASGEGVAVLISADRDPQSKWPATSAGGNGAYYGPSILTAPLSSLARYHTNNDAKFFGQGGLGLLKLRRDDPSQLHHVPVASTSQPQPDETRALAHGLGDEASQVIGQFWNVFDKHDGLWFSFVLTPSSSGELTVSAPYLEFDDFAVRRQPLLKPYFEARPRDPNTARAEDGGLFYVKLSHVSAPTPTLSERADIPDGNVGCFGYGAGNAMATMDGLNTAGGRPANFLDGGGGANRTNAKLAVETLNRDPDVKAIFVNTFGGITRTDIVSQGIIDAVKHDNITKPIVVRLKGTGSEEGAKVLKSSGLDFAFHDDFNQAAAHAVRAAKQGHL
ncbi:succinyl-CoA synthetase-like protein [Testicularia cyperi]|uniref:Succinyl-CoA synthetase-like protein n=1 Tax=Testicularia cyperi TaxID=1882483 RepID=A0A317XJK9_9BASI|nr:succinyl-CoA synthetase-like protein [Testicularia cyperi]